MAALSTATLNGTNTILDVTHASGNEEVIKVSFISGISREKNVVNVSHSGQTNMIRFDTEAEAVTLFNSLKALIT